MNALFRSGMYLPVAAMILTAALAIPGQAQTQVPFRGTFQGSDNVTPPTITTSGAGTGTQLGRFSVTNVLTLTSGTGTGHWIAADKNSVDSTFVSTPDFSTQSLGYITVTELHTITGGTGRFTGAQGSF